MTTTFATLRNNIQSTIHEILKADAVVKTYTSNFYDGIPSDATRGGFPYIINHTPRISPTRITMTKFKNVSVSRIEVVSQKEGNVRKLADAVTDALYRNQDTTRAQEMCWFKATSGDPRPSILPRGDSERDIKVWTIEIFAEYTLVVT